MPPYRRLIWTGRRSEASVPGRVRRAPPGAPTAPRAGAPRRAALDSGEQAARPGPTRARPKRRRCGGAVVARVGAPSAGEGAGYLVRRLRPDEWRELRALRLLALADAPDAFGATLAEAEADPDAAWQLRAGSDDRVVIVAESGGRLVGMASGGRAPVEGNAAGLYSMWVEPAARGSGVAAAIVAAVIAWAREAGYPVVGLGVTTTNARAIALYRRLGFADTGDRHPLREGSGLEIQIMVRPLE